MISGWVDFSCAGAAGVAVEDASPKNEMRSISAALCGPGIGLSFDPRAATWLSRESIVVLAWGAPRFTSPGLMDLARGQGAAAAWLTLYEEAAEQAPREVRGGYAVAILDFARKSALLATDRFSVRSLCYSIEGQRLAFSDRADTVPMLRERTLDMQAIYDYLYFHVIPAPSTVFRGITRLPASCRLLFQDGAANVSSYWTPHFDESQNVPFSGLKSEFRKLVRESVRSEADGYAVGCFLSGGTDSSTVVGTLGEVALSQPRTYSIGFDAHGYDEMAYARIAARHFKTDHHEYYLTPDDLVDGIPKVAAHYDQPFGNSSTLPAYYCALLAKADGLEKLLAGDGGDELFGGNARYAKQRLFGAYEVIPKAIRERAIEPLLFGTSALARLPVMNKAASYVRQARIRMPERMNAYNLLKKLGDAEVLTGEFLSSVDAGRPAAAEHRTYESCHARSLVNRMLAYDWKYTLADNDLLKVTSASALAGIAVGFPLLADEIVDFSLRLRPELKLKGLRLRYFFKEALRDFLPVEIINKRKHGFGLPFGVWVMRHDRLRDLAFASLRALARRDMVRREFLDDLMARKLSEHPAYYGELVWVLMMLEQWLQRRIPETSLASAQATA